MARQKSEEAPYDRWVLLLMVHLVHQQHLSTEQWPWDIRCPAKPILLESSPIPLIFFFLSTKQSTATILPAMSLGSSNSQAR